MGIFRRSYKTKEGIKTSKNWYAEFYIQNERFCETTGTSNKQEALKIALKLKEDIKASLGEDRKYLFEEALHGWYQEYLRSIDERRRKTHKIVQDLSLIHI